jgi:hypothetical protein
VEPGARSSSLEALRPVEKRDWDAPSLPAARRALNSSNLRRPAACSLSLSSARVGGFLAGPQRMQGREASPSSHPSPSQSQEHNDSPNSGKIEAVGIPAVLLSSYNILHSCSRGGGHPALINRLEERPPARTHALHHVPHYTYHSALTPHSASLSHSPQLCPPST